MADHQDQEEPVVGGDISKAVDSTVKNLCVPDYAQATNIIRVLGSTEKQRVEYKDVPRKTGHDHRCFSMSVTCEEKVKTPQPKKPCLQPEVEQEPEATEEQGPTSPDSHNVSDEVVDAGG